MALWNNRRNSLDDLAAKFAEESVIRQIDECEDIKALQILSKELARYHFKARRYIGQLLLESIKSSQQNHQ